MRPSPPYAGDGAWYTLQSKGRRWSNSLSWINVQSHLSFLLSLPGVTQVASYDGVAPGQLVASNATQGDVVVYDWDDDGVYDHESIVVGNDGTNADGTPSCDLVDAHTNNRYHEYWTLAQYNASWRRRRSSSSTSRTRRADASQARRAAIWSSCLRGGRVAAGPSQFGESHVLAFS